ncbi:MAG: agmatine deiminase family protein [bacterium]
MKKAAKKIIVMVVVIPFLYFLFDPTLTAGKCPCDSEEQVVETSYNCADNQRRSLPEELSASLRRDFSREGTTGRRRIFQKRSPEPWRNIVAKRQAQFAANPKDPQFARLSMVRRATAERRVISANETDPIDGLLTEWWCSSNGVPDEFDRMWMTTIGTTVKSGTTPYVYLFSYLGDDDETTLNTCSDMLERQEGISADEVYWIQDFETDAFWIRDFGPLFVRDIETQELSIEDPLYYPGRPLDDAEPADFASRIGVPLSEFNLYFEGGNFLPNGGGLCIASSVLLEANPHYTESEIREMFRLELGCENLVIVKALDDWATGHVDMWLAWANRTTLLVGEYTPQQDRINHSIIEENINNKLTGLVDPETGEPIKIVRIPMPSNCPPNLNYTWPKEPPAAPVCPGLPSRFRVWRTYLNVVPVNGKLLMPVYAQDKIYEEEAKKIWTNLGFDVVTVKADAITPLAGQLHCITKTMDAPK